MLSGDDEPPRKRIRKGTRSCWECKRRKTRCQFNSDSDAACVGCLNRGSTCVSQEHPEQYDASSGISLGERLRKVESLLETLVHRDELRDTELRFREQSSTPETESSPQDSHGLVMSLFDNTVLSRQDGDGITPTSQSTQSAPTRRQVASTQSKYDLVRRKLRSILPSQEDADLICRATNGWMLLLSLHMPATDLLVEKDSLGISFNLRAVSNESAVVIARTLLYLAVCINTLPRDFEPSRLQTILSLEDTMHKYISTASTLVLVDDEQISTIIGIQCLFVMAAFQINTGKLRHAWLTYRRAMTFAQLLGYDRARDILISPNGIETFNPVKKIWNQICDMDRFLGLHLRLPVTAPFEKDDLELCPTPNPIWRFYTNVGRVCHSISEFHQGRSQQTYARTLDLNEKLNMFTEELPAGWWDVAQRSVTDHSTEKAQLYERIMMQMWYFQLKSLLHLPFMLRANVESEYEFSRLTALQGSRETLQRYLTLRKISAAQSCRVSDFVVFVSTVILLLDLLNSSETSIDQQHDRQLIQSVIHELGKLAQCSREKIAAQGIDVIKKLLDTESRKAEQHSIRLLIPYFGNVEITRRSENSPDLSYALQTTPVSLSTSHSPMPYTSDLRHHQLAGSQPVAIQKHRVEYAESPSAGLSNTTPFPFYSNGLFLTGANLSLELSDEPQELDEWVFHDDSVKRDFSGPGPLWMF